jgi:hypothetical protein
MNPYALRMKKTPTYTIIEKLTSKTALPIGSVVFVKPRELLHYGDDAGNPKWCRLTASGMLCWTDGRGVGRVLRVGDGAVLNPALRKGVYAHCRHGALSKTTVDPQHVDNPADLSPLATHPSAAVLADVLHTKTLNAPHPSWGITGDTPVTVNVALTLVGPASWVADCVGQLNHTAAAHAHAVANGDKAGPTMQVHVGTLNNDA